MQFRGMEDRLNPVPPEDADESTLGGYLAIHGRSPGFEGSDGLPYTVAVETEETDEPGGWAAYFVFLRWAADSTAIMGHVETGDVAKGSTASEAEKGARLLTLQQVKELLEAAIASRAEHDQS